MASESTLARPGDPPRAPSASAGTRRQQRPPGTPARHEPARHHPLARAPRAARSPRARSPAAARPTATASRRKPPAGAAQHRCHPRVRPGQDGASGASGGRSTTPASSRATARHAHRALRPEHRAPYTPRTPSRSAGSIVLRHAERPPDRPRLRVERRSPRHATTARARRRRPPSSNRRASRGPTSTAPGRGPNSPARRCPRWSVLSRRISALAAAVVP